MQFRVTIAALCAAAVGCIAYFSSLDCGMCFDDETAIIKNRDLLPSTSWRNLLRNDFWGLDMASELSHKSYRPLTVATFRLNYMLHELEPLGYHLVNVLLHGGVCYLYVLLCGVVFGEVWPALIAGLLFAVHPIHTEAVAGLVGRAELLSALFFIGSYLSYTRAIKSRHGGEGKWMCLCLLLSLCSVLSKEQGITVLGVCLVTDLFIFQKMNLGSLVLGLISSTNSKKKLLSVSPVRLIVISRRAIAMVTFLVLFMVARVHIMKNAPRFPISVNPAAVLLEPPYRQLHWTYLSSFTNWLLFFPSRLSPEYAGTTIPLISSFTDLRNLVSIVTVAAYFSFGAFVFCRTRNDLIKRVGVLALSLLILPYLPASNLFFPVGFVVAERVLYLPSMGFCMLVAFGASQIVKSPQKIISLVVKFLICSLILTSLAKTMIQNRVWKTERDLYVSAIQSYPSNSKMWHNLGTKVGEGITLEQSELLMKRCIAMDPIYISAYSDLGLVYSKLDKNKEAEKVLAEAVELVKQKFNSSHPYVSKKDIMAFVRLSNLIKINRTRLPEALSLCLTALDYLPDDFRTLREAGHVLLHMGKLSQSKAYLQRAYDINPAEPNVVYLLGVAESELGNLDTAERNIREAIRLSPGSSSSVYERELVNVLRRRGKNEEAQILWAKHTLSPHTI